MASARPKAAYRGRRPEKILRKICCPGLAEETFGAAVCNPSFSLFRFAADINDRSDHSRSLQQQHDFHLPSSFQKCDYRDGRRSPEERREKRLSLAECPECLDCLAQHWVRQWLRLTNSVYHYFFKNGHPSRPQPRRLRPKPKKSKMKTPKKLLSFCL